MPSSLQQLERELWKLTVATHRDAAGKVRFKSSRFRGTKREAQAELLQMRAKYGAMDATQLDGANTTVAELLRHWVEVRKRDWSPKTLAETTRFIERRIIPELGQQQLGKVTPPMIGIWYGQLLDHGRTDGKGGLSPASVRRVHAVLHSAFGEAVRWDLLVRSPMDRVRPPRVQQTEIRPPNSAQLVEALGELEKLDYHLWMYATLAIITGARRGELCALQWRDVDLEAGVLLISKSMSEGPDGLVVKRPKSGRSRAITLDPDTLELLQLWHQRCVDQATGLKIDIDFASAYVFSLASDRARPLHPSTASHRWVAVARQLGLDGVRLHDLRHAMVSLALDAGVPVATVARRAGHASQTTTLAVYSHSIPETDVAAAKVIADRLRTGRLPS